MPRKSTTTAAAQVVRIAPANIHEPIANAVTFDRIYCNADHGPDDPTVMANSQVAGRVKPMHFYWRDESELPRMTFSCIGHICGQNGAELMTDHIIAERAAARMFVYHEQFFDVRPRRLFFDVDKIPLGNSDRAQDSAAARGIVGVFADATERVLRDFKFDGVSADAIRTAARDWAPYITSTNMEAHTFGMHMVAPRLIAQNGANARAFVRRIYDALPEPYHTAIDEQFLRAKRTQSLRTIFSAKSGFPDRIKEPYPSIGAPPDIVNDPSKPAETAASVAARAAYDAQLRAVIMRSFAQYAVLVTIDGAVQLPDIATMDDMENDGGLDGAPRSYCGEVMCAQAHHALAQFCAEHHLRAPYSGTVPRPSGDPEIGIIRLERDNPGYCPICKREHDRDGMYALIESARIRIRCRRSKERRSITQSMAREDAAAASEAEVMVWRDAGAIPPIADCLGDYDIHDCEKKVITIRSTQDMRAFRRMVKRNIAKITAQGGGYYLVRERDTDGRPNLEHEHDLESRNIQNCVIVHPDGTRTEMPFARAVAVFVGNRISYARADFVPHLRSHVPSAMVGGSACLNTWPGYQYDDPHAPALDDATMNELITPIVAHIRAIWAAGDDAAANYILNWFAHIVQYPCDPRRSALLIKGDQGCGKTRIAQCIAEILFGAHALITDVESFLKPFNAELDQKMLVVVDEVHKVRGDARDELADKIKAAITGTTLRINAKYKNERTTRNLSHYIFFSNRDAPLQLDANDRRFAVLRAAYLTSVTQDPDGYFAVIYDAFASPRVRAALFRFFATRDLAEFNVTDLPRTAERDADRIIGAPQHIQFAIAIVRDEINATHDDGPSMPITPEYNPDMREITVTCQVLYDAYQSWRDDNGFRGEVLSQRAFDIAMSDIIGKATRVCHAGNRLYMRKFTVAQIRDALYRRFSITIE